MASLKSGFLTKEGVVRKNWKKRWFVLRANELTYYKSQKDESKKGQGAITVREVTTVSPSNYKNKQYCLAVATPKRTFYLVAENNGEMQSWKEAIQAAVDKANGRTPAPKAVTPVAAAAPSATANTTPANTQPATVTVTPAPTAAPAPGAGAGTSPTTAAAATTTPTTTTTTPSPTTQTSAENIDLGPDLNKASADDYVTLEDFEVITVIGQGSFGKVVQCRHKKDGKVYAMKMLNKKSIVERGEIEHTKAEKAILQSIRHPFLMCLHFSFQTPDKLYLVMDFVNGGELFYHLQNEHTFVDARAKFYAAEIVLGLEYLHSHGIIYRDLKPENLLLDAEGHVKMTDFGLSKQGLNSPKDRTNTFCGTPEYLAPEVLQGKDYGKAVDWWSLGTLIFEMLTGLPPFYDEDVQKMYSLKMSADLEIPAEVNKDGADLIRKLLDRNPETRYQEPNDIKGHPWFADVEWQNLYDRKITPPYKPPVNDKTSVSLIDEGFLEMTITDVKSTGENANAHFEDFTYAPTK